MKQINVNIKKLHPDAVIPFYAHEGDAGMDLVAVEDAVIYPGETAIIKTGIAMAIPPGYELQIRPRSGMSAKTKIRVANSPGTVDSNYRGEIGVIVDNIEKTDYQLGFGFDDETGFLTDARIDCDESPFVINKGDRIAQGVFSEVPIAVLREVEDLDETNRGSNGFGSSGSRVQKSPFEEQLIKETTNKPI